MSPYNSRNASSPRSPSMKFDRDDTSTFSSTTSVTIRAKRISFKPTIHVREYLSNTRRSTTFDDDSFDTDDYGYKSRVWYTEPEYDQIEASNTKVVELIMEAINASAEAGNDDDVDCYPSGGTSTTNLSPVRQHGIEQELGDAVRGLEGLVPSWYDRKTELRNRAYLAVLDEQERQYRAQEYDPTAIAQVSRKATAACRKEAATIGLRDERFIRDHFGPLEPTGDVQYTTSAYGTGRAMMHRKKAAAARCSCLRKQRSDDIHERSRPRGTERRQKKPNWRV